MKLQKKRKKAFLIIVTDRIKRLYIGAVIFLLYLCKATCLDRLFFIVRASCSFYLALI